MQRLQHSTPVIYSIAFAALGFIAASPLLLGALAITVVQLSQTGSLSPTNLRMLAIVFGIPIGCYALGGLLLGIVISFTRLNTTTKIFIGAGLSGIAGIVAWFGLNWLLPSLSHSNSDEPAAAFAVGLTLLTITGLVAMAGGAAVTQLIDEKIRSHNKRNN